MAIVTHGTSTLRVGEVETILIQPKSNGIAATRRKVDLAIIKAKDAWAPIPERFGAPLPKLNRSQTLTD